MNIHPEGVGVFHSEALQYLPTYFSENSPGHKIYRLVAAVRERCSIWLAERGWLRESSCSFRGTSVRLSREQVVGKFTYLTSPGLHPRFREQGIARLQSSQQEKVSLPSQ